ncbi:uncharacterized protein N7496_005359 [Penicillium cataractarum]|uniref:Uncharacterized protein n=1 Tax=Penicillium cataractarum TaxID=2100454 RepID=A0A9W9VFU7_9EURO|nr:uncharacterized protein N7496_005359 [Penicillium cataractarum]KAJ5377950.1 hypothetical protein N7496_005359 [Penicillium cataractarum]
MGQTSSPMLAPIETKPTSHRNPLGPTGHTSTHGVGPSGIPNVYAPPSLPIRKPLQPLTHAGLRLVIWAGGEEKTWRGAHQILSLAE